MYDAAIVGTGPAGFSAAINLRLHNKNFIWFGSAAFSDKVQKSHKIANYPGFHMISGAELNEKLAAQADKLEIHITDKMVTSITKAEEYYLLLAANDVYKAKTVLLAVGVAAAKEIDGEQKLLGRGVSYCATCDGFFFKNKTIAVFCASPKYEYELEYLAGMAGKVYLYTPYKASSIALPNITQLEKPIKKIGGESKAESIILSDRTEIKVDGVFIMRNTIAPSTLLSDIEMDGAHIRVNRLLETNYSGCFAAGDCTGRPYQIAKAVGEGNVAAHSIIKYLADV